MQVLLDHLQKVIRETRDALRDISGQTYKMFKTANADTAKDNIEEALKIANSEHNTMKTERKGDLKLLVHPADQRKNPETIKLCFNFNVLILMLNK